MAEFINPIPQAVELNANVLFTETVVEPCPKIRHRRGSGVFTLKGGRYLVFFSGNTIVPADGTIGDISLAIAINGEALQGGVMTTTEPVVERYSNVSTMVYIDVPCNCCYTLSVKNVGEIPFTVDNANLVIMREV